MTTDSTSQQGAADRWALMIGRRRRSTPTASATQPHAPADGVVVVTSPATGTAIPLAEVPDQIFSVGMLGPGAAVHPSAGRITAPVDGELISVMPHAYGLRTDEGVELLVHIGLDTVELDGTHFTTAVAQGRRVARGDVIVDVDLAGIAAAGYDTCTVVLVTNPARFADVTAPEPRELTAADTLFTVVV